MERVLLVASVLPTREYPSLVHLDITVSLKQSYPRPALEELSDIAQACEQLQNAQPAGVADTARKRAWQSTTVSATPDTTAARALSQLRPLMARLEPSVLLADTALEARRWLLTAQQGPTTQIQERPKRQTVFHAQKASTALAQATQLQLVPARLAIIAQSPPVASARAHQLR